MQLPVNTFKRAIQTGQLQIGFWSILSSHLTVEILAGAGFDWLVLDTEHAPNELPMVYSQLQACAGGTAHPVVRVPWNDMVTIKRFLDIGVQTLLIPYVETEEQARNAVSYTRYPPRGVRGYSAAPRASYFGRVKDYPQICESELCVLVQIETRLGLDNLESIAGVEGVDGVFIGPGDLAASLGHAGDAKHPEVLAAVESAIKRIKTTGKPAGISPETNGSRIVISSSAACLPRSDQIKPCSPADQKNWHSDSCGGPAWAKKAIGSPAAPRDV